MSRRVATLIPCVLGLVFFGVAYVPTLQSAPAQPPVVEEVHHLHVEGALSPSNERPMLSSTPGEYTLEIGKSSTEVGKKYLEPSAAELPPEVHNSSWCQLRAGEDCCRRRGTPGVKVWDSFTFNGDWEMFELRLGMLSPWVDHFVVLQSNLTFGGQRREYVRASDPRIAPWKNCIRLVTVLSAGTDAPVSVSTVATETGEQTEVSAGTWFHPRDRDDVEVWFRDHAVYGYRPVSDRASGSGVADSDWVIFSDLDEVPDPRVLVWLVERHAAARWFVLHFKEYTYGFWNERSRFQAPSAAFIVGSDAKKYKMSLVYLHGRRGGHNGDRCTDRRKKHRRARTLYLGAPFSSETACAWYSERFSPRSVFNAGWHCSNCFPSVGRILKKLCAFGWMHDLLVSRGYTDPKEFLKVVQSGRIVHSTSKKHMAAKFDRRDGNLTAPPFARVHPKRFSFFTSSDFIQLGDVPAGGCSAFVQSG
ncbi:hypothetical protein DIPPA_17729 [Diplonema papillatum]|nr:hypothetical protein DIPPA_17729 [Diplonema papillatum]